MSTTSRWPCSTRRRISPRTAIGGTAARGAAHERDHAERAGEAAAVLHLHERADAVEARVRLDAADRADVARDEARRLLAPSRHDDDVVRKPGERVGGEVRSAPGDVDAPVRARRASRLLARLRHGLVRDAAGVDHRDVGAVVALRMPVGEQPLAHVVRVDVRDLAAEKADGEARHAGNLMGRGHGEHHDGAERRAVDLDAVAARHENADRGRATAAPRHLAGPRDRSHRVQMRISFGGATPLSNRISLRAPEPASPDQHRADVVREHEPQHLLARPRLRGRNGSTPPVPARPRIGYTGPGPSPAPTPYRFPVTRGASLLAGQRSARAERREMQRALQRRPVRAGATRADRVRARRPRTRSRAA